MGKGSSGPGFWMKALPLLVPVLALLGTGCLGLWREAWTLWPGLLLVFLSLHLAGPPRLPETPSPPLDPARERILLLILLAVAVFLRLYRLRDVPEGIHVDVSVLGLGGLRVLHEGWRPVFEDSFSTHPGLIYYLSAAWFRFFEPTRDNWLLFSTTLSLLSLLPAYWVFRQLAGSRIALMALGFLAVMRWDLALGRGYPLHDAVLFLLAGLAFWLWGLGKGGFQAMAACAIAFSAGLYTYHGYKPVLLLIVLLALYEVFTHPEIPRKRRGPLLLMAVLSLLLMGPMFLHWFGDRSVGSYEMNLFIGRTIQEEGSWAPLGRNLLTILASLHRKGDASSYLNFGAAPMLDPLTGAFFFLGLAVVLRHWRKRGCFYPLAALAVMGLNSLLSVEPEQSLARRLFAWPPFLALVAAYGGSRILEMFRSSPSALFRRWVPAVPVLAFLLAMVLNFEDYFLRQARDPGYHQASDPTATELARRIAGTSGEWRFLLDERYARHFTILFMNYHRQEGIGRMDWPEGLALGQSGGKKGACFVFAEGAMGRFRYAKSLYPDAEVEILRDRSGGSVLYFLKVPPAMLDGSRGLPVGKGGLEARYFLEGDREVRLTRRELLVNFPHRAYFPLQRPSFRAEWRGKLRIDRPGRYEFLLLTESGDRAVLRLGGRILVPSGRGSHLPVELGKGGHVLELDLKSSPEKFSALSLAWKRPGETAFEIVPPEAFEGYQRK